MTPDQLVRVGERFYRADNLGLTPRIRLGVTFFIEIVPIYGGNTEFISTKGKGMTSTVWLPILNN